MSWSPSARCFATQGVSEQRSSTTRPTRISTGTISARLGISRTWTSHTYAYWAYGQADFGRVSLPTVFLLLLLLVSLSFCPELVVWMPLPARAWRAGVLRSLLADLGPLYRHRLALQPLRSSGSMLGTAVPSSQILIILARACTHCSFPFPALLLSRLASAFGTCL